MIEQCGDDFRAGFRCRNDLPGLIEWNFEPILGVMIPQSGHELDVEIVALLTNGGDASKLDLVHPDVGYQGR